MLDHPVAPFNLHELRIRKVLYSNPHNPPPGGFARAAALQRPGTSGYGNLTNGGRTGWNSRWSGTAPNGKSVEIQRSQVDQVFNSLKSGDELEETEARECPNFLFFLFMHPTYYSF